jgi:steroid 5-alpha reductase family enzyme
MFATINLPLEPRLYAAAALCIFISLTAFINSTQTKNYSFVDREWSISPIFYAWILSGCLEGGLFSNSRALAMALFISLWGARLTFNFWRRGGYQAGEQDYRWPILQKIITNPIAWHTFNLVFISFYQNILLFLICLPVYVVSLAPTRWQIQDSIYLSICFLLLVGEYASDQQQWNFQCEKHRLLKLKGGDISQIDLPYRYGFRTSGLFRWSRHPNFFCEVMQWIMVAFFTISVNQELGLWIYSFLGCFLLATLFIG